ncbi:MAG: LTA synthase family protein [Defluviitaleaceae bacterium]|nr:LTA synthase family protein [Defluviitaleaceae bacterium]
MDYRLTVPFGLCFALMAAVSLITTVGVFFLQPRENRNVFKACAETFGAVFILNMLPIFILTLFVFFASGHAFTACCTAAFSVLLLAAVNRYMSELRFAPFKPLDILLSAEFFGVAKSMKTSVFVMFGSAAALFFTLIFMGLIFIKNGPVGFWTRITGASAAAVFFIAIVKTIYANKKIYGSLPVYGDKSDENMHMQSKGFIYYYLNIINKSKVSEPNFYNEFKSKITVKEQASVNRQEKILKPNIIMVLSEGFSELPLNPGLLFDGFTDPLFNYKKIKSESISGQIIVPRVGGGTSDTEFDILTGINTRDFNNLPFSFRLIKKQFPGMASALAANGYKTVCMHPGSGWFYRRKTVYPFMQFKNFIDIDAYPKKEYSGGYVSEKTTMDFLIESYRNHLQKNTDENYFAFCITIQNHGPYAGKYGANKNFGGEINFTSDEIDSLSNYFYGLADCDRELLRLTQYLKKTDEPSILVYFGDHLPTMSPQIFKKLLPNEKPAPFNRLPYFIWANDAARGIIETACLQTPLPRVMSAHYLGALILQLTGMDEADVLLKFLNEIRNKYPIVTEDQFTDAAGNLSDIDLYRQTDIALHKAWGYHRIKK